MFFPGLLALVKFIMSPAQFVGEYVALLFDISINGDMGPAFPLTVDVCIKFQQYVIDFVCYAQPC